MRKNFTNAGLSWKKESKSEKIFFGRSIMPVFRHWNLRLWSFLKHDENFSSQSIKQASQFSSLTSAHRSIMKTQLLGKTQGSLAILHNESRSARTLGDLANTRATVHHESDQPRNTTKGQQRKKSYSPKVTLTVFTCFTSSSSKYSGGILWSSNRICDSGSSLPFHSGASLNWPVCLDLFLSGSLSGEGAANIERIVFKICSLFKYIRTPMKICPTAKSLSCVLNPKIW